MTLWGGGNYGGDGEGGEESSGVSHGFDGIGKVLHALVQDELKLSRVVVGDGGGDGGGGELDVMFASEGVVCRRVKDSEVCDAESVEDGVKDRMVHLELDEAVSVGRESVDDGEDAANECDVLFRVVGREVGDDVGVTAGGEGRNLGDEADVVVGVVDAGVGEVGLLE